MDLDHNTLERILISCKNAGRSHFSLTSELTQKQIRNAIQSYAPKVSPADIVALLDDTLLHSGKEGFLITCSNLYS